MAGALANARSAWDVLRGFYQRAAQDRLSMQASALSFQALFAIVPLIAIGFAVFAALGGMDALEKQVELFLVRFLAPTAADQISEYVALIRTKVSPKAIGFFGVLGFLYTCFSMFAQIEETLNGIWRAPHGRPWWQRILYYSVGVLLGPVIIGASLTATSYVGSQIASGSFLSEAVLLTLTLAPVVTSSLFLAAIYWLMPFAHVSTRAAVIAGFAAGVGIEVLKTIYGMYATYSLQNSVYGSLAALPILFLWIWLAASTFLWGAELCCFLDRRSLAKAPA